MVVSLLRIRIPHFSYDERDEVTTFGNLYKYLSPDELCRSCTIDNENACSLCCAISVKKSIINKEIQIKCIKHFNEWAYTLMLRKYETF